MFKKIDIIFPEINIDSYKVTPRYINRTFGEFNIVNTQLIKDIVFSKLKFDILPDITNLTEILYPGASPHTDAWPVALNIYLNTNSATTRFWESSDLLPVGRLASEFIRTAELTEIGNFVASAGECILINTHVIHSVEMINPAEQRKILRFAWIHADYEAIKSTIHILDTTLVKDAA